MFKKVWYMMQTVVPKIYNFKEQKYFNNSL